MKAALGEVRTGSSARVSMHAVRLTMVAKIAEAATLVALVLLVPSRLGPGDYGTFAVALSLVTLGSASAALGGPALMARLVAAAPPSERPALARAVAVRAAKWRGAWVATIAVCAAVLAFADPSRFGAAATAVVVLAIALDVAATLVFSVALAFGRTTFWSLRYPIQNGALVIGALGLYAGLGLDGALAAIPLSSGVALLVGAGVARGLRVAPGGATISAEASRFAFLQGLSGVLFQITHRGPVLAVALLAGSHVQTGYAALVVGVATALIYLGWQLFTVSLPRVTVLRVEAPALADAAIRHLAWTALAVLAPLSLVGAALGEPALSRLAGGQFAGAGDALAVALAVAPLAALTGSAGAASTVHFRADARVWIAGAGAVVFAVSALALIPSLGAAGASGALLAATVASALVGVVLFPVLRSWPLAALCAASSLATLAVGLAQ